MINHAYVTLALTPGIGRVRLEQLIGVFRSAEAVLGAPFGAIAGIHGFGPAIATAIVEADRQTGSKIAAQVDALGGTILAPGDDAFPAALNDIPDAPILLFALGRVELLRSPCVAIVGARAQTRYGSEVARHFAGGLARAGLVVASGMARGIDASAHTAALDAGGGTIGVLGNGFGVIYPSANRALYERVASEGCLLTEYPPGERPNAGSFPRRNRLISGLSRVTLVVEAGSGSGALITAGCALAQGRDVLAVPGPVTSPLSLGCNQLIQHGAKPALGLRDVLEEYGIAQPGVPGASLPTNLTEDERRMLDLLGLGIDQIDELTVRFGRSTADALAILTSLEIRGIVVQEPGKRFRGALSHSSG